VRGETPESGGNAQRILAHGRDSLADARGLSPWRRSAVPRSPQNSLAGLLVLPGVTFRLSVEPSNDSCLCGVIPLQRAGGRHPPPGSPRPASLVGRGPIFRAKARERPGIEETLPSRVLGPSREPGRASFVSRLPSVLKYPLIFEGAKRFRRGCSIGTLHAEGPPASSKRWNLRIANSNLALAA